MNLKSAPIKIEPKIADLLLNLKQVLDKSKGVVISGHINPDGDVIGSQLALIEYFTRIEKPCLCINDDEVPHSFRFLPNTQRILRFDNSIELSNTYDTLIVVDSGNLERIGRVTQLLYPSITIVNIDHHLDNTGFGDLNIVLEKAACIGEILFYFFQLIDFEINYNIALYLYVSIVTDTGNFRYDLMHPEVHRIAAQLLEKGVRANEVHIALDQNKPLSHIRLLSLVLSRLELFSEGRIAFSYLKYDDFDLVKDYDTEGLIEHLEVIDTVVITILIKEKERGKYNASLRSKYDINVAEIAARYGGGGHYCAAGCTVKTLSLDQFRDSLLADIEAQL